MKKHVKTTLRCEVLLNLHACANFLLNSWIREITAFHYYSTLHVDKSSDDVRIHIAKTHFDARDGGSIYLQNQSIWSTVKTFDEGYGFVGVLHLSTASEARYVVVSRYDVINLKEVHVYQNACE